MASVIAGLVASAIPDLPKIEGSRQFASVPGKVFARDGHTVLRRLRAQGTRSYEHDIPLVLEHAVVAAEDHRFYHHRGVDPTGLARAAWVDLLSRSLQQGGSTVTQQLVKNTYAGTERTAARKSREAVYALALETRWNKHRIMTAYLNTAYFGTGAYGIRDASRLYFGKQAKHLNIAESALLAAMLRAPERSNPLNHPAVARSRRTQVLDSMHQLGYANDDEIRRARAYPLPTPASIEARRNASAHELAPHFVDDVVGKLIDRYGVAQIMGGGVRVRTTIDPNVQQAAVDALSRIDGTGLGASIVVVSARSGEVLAMANGGSAAQSAFNVASNGHRQPGSAFKPFALTAALRAGMTPRTELLSAPYQTTVNGKRWNVTNDGGYAGTTTLQAATWKSDNTAYARLTEQIGVDSVITAARNAGITSRMDAVPAITLGGLPEGVTPLELARAYATFANHGTPPSARGWSMQIISAAHPRLGRLRDTFDDSGTRTAVRTIDRPVADQVTAMLRGVVRQGTGTKAAFGSPLAGKTGTTENNADAWFVGYTPDIVAAVWVGHPEGTIPMRSEYFGGPVFGGTYPALIFHDAMQQILAGRTVHEFSLKQPRYVNVRIDPANGLLADAWCAQAETRQFIAGRAPTRTSATCAMSARSAPNVVGMPIEQARTLLDDSGFSWTERLIGAPTSAQQGQRVFSQSPVAGTQVTRDQDITLVVVPENG